MTDDYTVDDCVEEIVAFYGELGISMEGFSEELHAEIWRKWPEELPPDSALTIASIAARMMAGRVIELHAGVG